jgi:hypothetical protein
MCIRMHSIKLYYTFLSLSLSLTKKTQFPDADVILICRFLRYENVHQFTIKHITHIYREKFILPSKPRRFNDMGLWFMDFGKRFHFIVAFSSISLSVDFILYHFFCIHLYVCACVLSSV